jgi:hypothetical protein
MSSRRTIPIHRLQFPHNNPIALFDVQTSTLLIGPVETRRSSWPRKSSILSIAGGSLPRQADVIRIQIHGVGRGMQQMRGEAEPVLRAPENYNLPRSETISTVQSVLIGALHGRAAST